MNTMRRNYLVLAVGLPVTCLAAFAGWWLGHNGLLAPSEIASRTHSEQAAVLYWYDPMSPQHHFAKPGKSPFMDMELVPKYASAIDAGEPASDSVKIDAQIAQNIGLREAAVERIKLQSIVEATGLLAFNEREVALEQVRSDGLVTRVWPLAPGDVIAVGQPLAELLLPQWTAAQAEYLVLQDSGDSALADAGRERLRLLGMPAQLIEELQRSKRAQQGFVLNSSRAGVLESLDVRAGMVLKAGQMLARIQGIDSIWLEVAVPESRAGAVQLNGQVEVRLSAYPERTFSGRITAVLPSLASTSRTLRVRVELPNPTGQLRVGMSAQVRMATNAADFALAVPTEAVIRTGKRTVVFVVDAGGRFTPVDVILGPEIDDRTVISQGLNEGQSVVASAQFLLDSEASLSGVFSHRNGTLTPQAPDRPGPTNGMGEKP